MPKVLNLIGEKFSELTVISLFDLRNKKTRWTCFCRCGQFTIVSTGNLRNGHTRSCGCLKQQTKRYDNLVNQIFGQLTVISLSHIRNKKRALWNCLCECGNIVQVLGYNLKNGHTKSCGCYFEFVMKNRTGNKNPAWNDNLSEEDRINRNVLPENTKWRKLIVERDNYTCQLSGQVRGKLFAHHFDGWHWCKEKRFDLDNGITLSEKIHKLFHNQYGNRNNTREQFEEFRQRYNSGEFENKV